MISSGQLLGQCHQGIWPGRWLQSVPPDLEDRVQRQFSTKALLFLFSGSHLFFSLRKGSAEPSMFCDQGKDFSSSANRRSSIAQRLRLGDCARFPSTQTLLAELLRHAHSPASVDRLRCERNHSFQH